MELINLVGNLMAILNKAILHKGILNRGILLNRDILLNRGILLNRDILLNRGILNRGILKHHPTGTHSLVNSITNMEEGSLKGKGKKARKERMQDKELDNLSNQECNQGCNNSMVKVGYNEVAFLCITSYYYYLFP
jgi:hypothetical protein